MRKIGTILLSLGVAVVLIMIGAAVLLPSTKRGSYDFERLQQLRQEAEAAAATRASTQPTPPATTQTAEGPDEGYSPASE